MPENLNAPRWNLSNVYPALNSPELSADIARVKADLQSLKAYFAEHAADLAPGNAPATLHAALTHVINELNQISERAGTVRAYIYSFVATDSYNTEARQMLSRFEQVGVEAQIVQQQALRLIGALGDDLESILALGGVPAEHAFALREIVERSKFLMSPAEEELAAKLSPSSSNAWSKLQGTITSQLTVDFELNGETQKLPMPALINLRSHPDPEVRRRAYEAETAAWKTVEESLAAALNGVKGTTIVLNRRRGYRDDLHPSIIDARIDEQTLEAMLGAMHDSFPMFERYFKAKAAKLGKEKLAWWDLFAPLGKTDTTFTFEQAREFVVSNFRKFSPQLADFAQRAFDNAWIDAEQRPGKRGGAFCMGVPGVKESRVLCNFDGSLDQVFTIAHELGHAFHNECAFQANKTPLQTNTPMTLAETASIMCETIILQAALKETTDPQEELAILETSLNSDSQVIVDIYSRYLFEKEVFERRAQSELSAQDFCEIMARAQRTTYGEGLDENLQPYMWTWKPHYYYSGLSFYNYPYAFGSLFGIGLYAIYQQRGEAFVPDYVNLLASTGEGTAAELAARFGIDIRSRKFWQDSLNVIGERIERYAAL